MSNSTTIQRLGKALAMPGPVFLFRAVCFVVLMGVTFSSLLHAEEKIVQLDTQKRIRMRYLLHLPRDYAAHESWPLVLFLHGSGERGTDIELVKKHGPPKLASQGKDFPFVLVSPQCPKGAIWQPIALEALLDDVIERYRIDQSRIYVTGLSMGGFGTWAWARHSPRRFAAIVPICGGGETYWADRLKEIPAWVFHGARDTAVPIKRSEEMVAAIKKAGGNIRFTIYPMAEHDSWTETYNNPMLYQWMLSQKNKFVRPDGTSRKPDAPKRK